MLPTYSETKMLLFQLAHYDLRSPLWCVKGSNLREPSNACGIIVVAWSGIVLPMLVIALYAHSASSLGRITFGKRWTLLMMSILNATVIVRTKFLPKLVAQH